VETPLFRSTYPDYPADQLLQPDDIAGMALFLAGDGAIHLNGESIVLRKP
jgi:hypothetical protein